MQTGGPVVKLPNRHHVENDECTVKKKIPVSVALLRLCT